MRYEIFNLDNLHGNNSIPSILPYLFTLLHSLIIRNSSLNRDAVTIYSSRVPLSLFLLPKSPLTNRVRIDWAFLGNYARSENSFEIAGRASRYFFIFFFWFLPAGRARKKIYRSHRALASVGIFGDSCHRDIADSC